MGWAECMNAPSEKKGLVLGLISGVSSRKSVLCLGNAITTETWAKMEKPHSVVQFKLPGSPSDLNTGNGTEGATGCPSWRRPLRPLFHFLCSNLKANTVDNSTTTILWQNDVVNFLVGYLDFFLESAESVKWVFTMFQEWRAETDS